MPLLSKRRPRPFTGMLQVWGFGLATLAFLCFLPAYRLAGSSIGMQAYNLVQDEGVSQGRATTINFTGAGVTCGPTAAGVTPCDIPGAGGGGSCAGLAGDVSGTCAANVVDKVNGVAYSAGPSTDTVPIITAANTATYKALPDCDGTLQGLNYDVTTHAWSCRTYPAQQHVAFSFVIDGGGSPITTGALGLFPTAAFTCTINRIDVSADVAGIITVDIWKKAGAIPAAADKISASAPATLASAQLSQNGSLTGWGTAVVSGDVFGGTIVTASTVTRVTVQIWCRE